MKDANKTIPWVWMHHTEPNSLLPHVLKMRPIILVWRETKVRTAALTLIEKDNLNWGNLHSILKVKLVHIHYTTIASRSVLSGSRLSLSQYLRQSLDRSLQETIQKTHFSLIKSGHGLKIPMNFVMNKVYLEVRDIAKTNFLPHMNHMALKCSTYVYFRKAFTTTYRLLLAYIQMLFSVDITQSSTDCVNISK